MSQDKSGGGSLQAVDFDPFAGPALQQTAPSTEPQREIWAAARLGPEASLAFNESISLVFEGALDVSALRSALGDLLARHEALRATFSSDGLTLSVMAEVPVDLPVDDLSNLAGADQQEALRRLLAREVETPFDLERGPLVRARLARLGPERHQLVFTGHHIVVDGWSTAVIVSDWARLYSARRAGRAPALPPADGFCDYARELAGAQGGPERVADEAYWLQQCAGELPVLDLPADRARPALKTFAARRLDVELDPQVAQRLRQTGAREGASFFVTLLAGFAALLQRLTGQQDVVVGIPAAGQAAAGRHTLVGHCVNTLPLRAAVRPGEPFRELLRRAKGALLDAYEHQGLTFGALLGKLPLPRDPSRQPLVSVVFNVDQALAAEALAFEGLQVEFRSNPRHFETFDLFVNAVDGGGRTVLECQYNTDLYDEATLRRWLRSLELLLRAAAEDPGRSVGELPLLDEAERQRLVFDWNATEVEPRASRSVAALFAEQVAARPEAPALVFEGGQLTYAELERQANRLARRLQRQGVGPDVPVGVLLERSPDAIVALLAILKAGGGYLPLETQYPQERLAFMLADAQAPLVLTHSAQAGLLPESSAAVLLLDQEREALAREAADAPDCPAGPRSLAYVIYTSGSTGRPKGVAVEQRSIERLVRGVSYADLSPERTLLQAANLAFDASTFEVWGALLNGGRLALHPENVPTGAGLARSIQAFGVDTLWLTAALFNAVVDEDPRLLSGLRQLLTGGEALSVPHVRRALAALPETRLVNGYGPTETTTFATTLTIPRDLGPQARSVPIGRPIRDTRCYVVDERREPVPVGVAGELLIGGEGVARGYLGRPELTAERFLDDPFRPGERVYRSGDLVRWLPSGEIEFLGRRDDQVKIRGFRIELGEIEAALGGHPAVAQAAVAVRPDRTGAPTLVAYVVPQAGQQPGREDLLEHLRRTLPRFMVPQHVLTLERMPLNASGKVDRRALPAPALESVAAEHVPPSTPTEQLLAGLWQRALGLPRLSVHDDFFRLGGHSLLAAQVLSRLNREHGIELPFRAVFENPTLAQMAAAIDRLAGEARPAAAPIPRREDDAPAPVTVMQERILLLEELDPERRRVHAVPSAFRLEGPLDVAALGLALDAVVARHEPLRTTFRRENGALAQVVGPAYSVGLQVEELSAASAEEREAALRARLEQEVRRPFDPATGPLFRAFLFRLGAQEHVLFTLRHNTVWDGWSFDVFRHELATFYEARLDGREARLPELPVRYRDYAAWHREYLAGEEIGRQLAHWRARLAGDAAPLELPTDRPRPATRGYLGADEWIDVPRAEADRLAELARAHGATTFMLLLAAFDVLLARLSGQRDLLVATPVRNRPRPEIEDLIGLFTNTLVMRTEVDPQESFTALLARVRATVVEAFGHQDLPFDLLGREAPPVRVLFSLQEARHRETALGAARLSLPHVLPPAAAVDMNFWLVELQSGLTGALNYSTELFERATIRRFLACFRELLRSILRDPSQAVGRLALVGEEERARLVAGEVPAVETPEAPPSLAGLLARQAEGRSGVEALRRGGRSLSFGELSERARRFAGGLRQRGLEPGARVALALPPGLERTSALLGLLWGGAVPVPLDHEDPPARLKEALQIAEAAWLVAEPDLADDVGFDGARVLSAGLEGEALPAPAMPAGWQAVVPRPEGGLAVHHVSEEGLPGRLASAARLLELREGDLVALSGGSPALTLLPLAAGAALLPVLAEEAEDGEALRDLLAREGAGCLWAPATTWRRLLAAGWRPTEGFRAVASEPLPSDLAGELLQSGARLFAAWGVEEAGDLCALKRVERVEQAARVGAPLPGLGLGLRDPYGEPVPDGVPGELVVTPAGGRPPLASGARARRGPDGLQLLGRGDGRLRVRGVRVEAAEVRRRLLEHAAVEEAAVLLRDDLPGEPRLVAYLRPRPGASTTDTELRRTLRRQLPAAAVPQHFVTLESWPRRLEPRALPAPFARTRGEERPPRSDEERLLAELWCQALGLARVDVRDNFFDLGGHSLLCLEVVERLRQRTGRSLPARLLLLSTLEQVAAELARAEPA